MIYLINLYFQELLNRLVEMLNTSLLVQLQLIKKLLIFSKFVSHVQSLKHMDRVSLVVRLFVLLIKTLNHLDMLEDLPQQLSTG